MTAHNHDLDPSCPEVTMSDGTVRGACMDQAQIVSTGNERDDDPSNDELRSAGFTLPSEGTLNEYEWDADTGRWVASTGRLAHRKRYDEHGFPLPQGPFMWEGYAGG